MSCPPPLTLPPKQQHAGPAECGAAHQYLALDYMRVMHIQEGVEEQNVLFHSFMHKTLQGLQATVAAK